MRKVLIAAAAAASALTFATPASAQFFPVQYRSVQYYPVPHYPARYLPVPAYAYGQNVGHARVMKARVDHIQREIRRLAAFRMISRAEYHNLLLDSRQVERRLVRNARDGFGLSPSEAYDTERRIARLEWRIARDVRDGRRWAYRW